VNHPWRFPYIEVVQKFAVETDRLGTDAAASTLDVLVRERRKKRS
jgi:hypothetical protein